MKRQLDRLKGKRLVTGDPNLMTKDEICINATPNGVEVKEIGTDGSIKDIASGGGGGGDSEELEYYKLGDVQFLNDNQPNYVIKNILLNKYPEIDDFDDSIRNYIGIVTAFSTEFMINFRTGQYNGHSIIGLYFIAVMNSDVMEGQPMIAYFAIKKNINIITDKYYPNINAISETINTTYNSIKYVKELESITVKISKEEYDNAIAIAKNTIIK